MPKNFDVLEGTTTNYNIIGQPIGYSHTVINLGPLCAIITVIMVITIFTVLFWPKKHGNK
jgi:hypothetical protein